ncbi:hypothetical protein THAOC_02429 [Thalassiosira oceanica]|uniref:AB hydrolase-1 domain-containing protein n=1 Tax=Thalassiosira oceanica TaxID=159749 RepID=K0TM29_THAOC|nr:hypothetical protein THAOC_02429 [Thalassiosira oceanica]|eukprot:EJK75831.1 hypothetical protein THAOC_02429 [Thalassiosira oceanica]
MGLSSKHWAAFWATTIMPNSSAFRFSNPSDRQPAIGYNVVACDSGNDDGAPATLFIHGLDSSSRTWKGVQEVLKYPSISIDCRGCGKSEMGSLAEFAPQALVEDVKSIVRDEKLLQQKFVLCGHSMGGGLQCVMPQRIPMTSAP